MLNLLQLVYKLRVMGMNAAFRMVLLFSLRTSRQTRSSTASLPV